MKQFFKRLSRNETLRRLLCWLGAQYIRLVHATSRWQVVGGEIPARHWDSGQTFILAFWHGRLLLMPYIWRYDKPVHMLISHHRDGRLIADTIKHFGIETVSGSTNRGGSAALRGMLKVLKNGDYVGITPDGPRGPCQRVSAGIVTVARLAGVPIIPATYAVKRRRLLRTWDRFAMALPFTKGVFVWGRPIEVPRDASEAAMEALREDLESRLNAITAAADSRMGHAALEPAPWPVEMLAPVEVQRETEAVGS
mgnify:FL=1